GDSYLRKVDRNAGRRERARKAAWTRSPDLPIDQVAVEEATARDGRRDGERHEKQDLGVVVVPKHGHLLSALRSGRPGAPRPRAYRGRPLRDRRRDASPGLPARSMPQLGD